MWPNSYWPPGYFPDTYWPPAGGGGGGGGGGVASVGGLRRRRALAYHQADLGRNMAEEDSRRAGLLRRRLLLAQRLQYEADREAEKRRLEAAIYTVFFGEV